MLKKLERFIPQQKKMSSHLGGFLVLIGESMFFISIFNFVLITRIQYYNPGDSFLRTIFPYYILFFIAVGIGALLIMIIVYIFIIPSKNLFGQQQIVKDNRSPTYDLLMEVYNNTEELKKEIDKLKKENNNAHQ